MAAQKKDIRKKNAQKKNAQKKEARMARQKTGALIARWFIIMFIVLALVGGVVIGAIAQGNAATLPYAATSPYAAASPYGYKLSPAATSPHGYELSPAATSPYGYYDVRPDDTITGNPIGDYTALTDDIPDISADYAALFTSDGRILYARDADTQTSMASTTKIMTAIVAIETTPLTQMMQVTAGAARTEGSSAGLTAGMVLPLSDLLYCLLLPSGNDAAVVIAENVSGTESRFVTLMNEKALALGMNSTQFQDASGLADDGHYTTVNDYVKLVTYAMKNEVFREVVAARYKEIYVNGRLLFLQGTNQLYNAITGATVTGIKTGFTSRAGQCFIGSAIKNGVELYAIIFHHADPYGRFVDCAKLLEWGFRHFRTIELLNPNQQVGAVSLTSWLDKTVDVYVPAAVRVEIFDLNGPIDQEIVLYDIAGAVVKGQVCGTIVWTQDGMELARSDIVAAMTVSAPSFFERIKIGWTRFWSFFSHVSHHAEGYVLLKPQVPVPDATY